jgi:hypothetical protein
MAYTKVVLHESEYEQWLDVASGTRALEDPKLKKLEALIRRSFRVRANRTLRASSVAAGRRVTPARRWAFACFTTAGRPRRCGVNATPEPGLTVYASRT